MRLPPSSATERGVLLPFHALFRWLGRHASFTLATAMATSGLAVVPVIIFVGLLAIPLAILSVPIVHLFAPLVLMLCMIGFLLWSHFGLLRRIGIPCFSGRLNQLNTHIKKNVVHLPAEDDAALQFYATIGHLPLYTTAAAIGYSALALVALAGWRWMMEGIAGILVLPLVSCTLPLTIFVFSMHLSTGLFVSSTRHRIQQHLFSRRIPFRETTDALIGRRFALFILLVVTAMAQLAILLFAAAQKGAFDVAIIFTSATIIGVCLLAALSFLSVRYAMQEIQLALMDIAYGGGPSPTEGSAEKWGTGLIQAAYEIGDIRTNLEQRIQDRTQELSETMAALRRTLDEAETIKLQQDGDFFLTSLLLEPLSKNRASCVNLSVDFFIHEKKRFQFKKWNREIGGDICIAHSIFLKNRIYTVVLNADAMGKSMQGAGGAIVLGACMKAIIDRTRFSSMEQDRHPEDWLHRAYVELQRVFEGFECSMLVSIVLSLIDDESGLMYYINAEHPWTVLYREGKASFIENELRLRKLGVPNPGAQFAVQLFRFRPGDVIIMGSDGRDDILIGGDNDSQGIMNEDERLFLTLVEQGQGRLDGIYGAILATGCITDDLSLARVAFQENRVQPSTTTSIEIVPLINQAHAVKTESPERALELLRSALAIQKDDPTVLKRLIRLLASHQHFADTIEYLERYVDLRPDDSEMLYVASYCFMKVGNNQKAAELCERIVLRQPDEVKYLLHLARIQANRHDYFEADRLLDQILQIAPENEQALSLKNSL